MLMHKFRPARRASYGDALKSTRSPVRPRRFSIQIVDTLGETIYFLQEAVHPLPSLSKPKRSEDAIELESRDDESLKPAATPEVLLAGDVRRTAQQMTNPPDVSSYQALDASPSLGQQNLPQHGSSVPHRPRLFAMSQLDLLGYDYVKPGRIEAFKRPNSPQQVHQWQPCQFSAPSTEHMPASASETEYLRNNTNFSHRKQHIVRHNTIALFSERPLPPLPEPVTQLSTSFPLTDSDYQSIQVQAAKEREMSASLTLDQERKTHYESKLYTSLSRETEDEDSIYTKPFQDENKQIYDHLEASELEDSFSDACEDNDDYPYSSLRFS